MYKIARICYNKHVDLPGPQSSNSGESRKPASMPWKSWQTNSIEAGFFVEIDMLKICSKCKQEKEVVEFHKCAGRAGGYQAWCKECKREPGAKKRTRHYSGSNSLERARELCRKYREDNHEKEINRIKAWRAAHKDNGRKYRLSNPEKDKAWLAVTNAVSHGKIRRASAFICSIQGCENQADQYHHHNGYDREHWLDVVPICRAHHGEMHRKS